MLETVPLEQDSNILKRINESSLQECFQDFSHWTWTHGIAWILSSPVPLSYLSYMSSYVLHCLVSPGSLMLCRESFFRLHSASALLSLLSPCGQDFRILKDILFIGLVGLVLLVLWPGLLPCSVFDVLLSGLGSSCFVSSLFVCLVYKDIFLLCFVLCSVCCFVLVCSLLVVLLLLVLQQTLVSFFELHFVKILFDLCLFSLSSWALQAASGDSPHLSCSVSAETCRGQSHQLVL